MRQRALHRTVAGLVAAAAVGLAVVTYVVLHEPASYRRVTAPAGPERRMLSVELLTGLNNLQESFQRRRDEPGDTHWQETFTVEQINSYFEEDFVRARPIKLPERIHSPRISIEPGRFRLAFRYGHGFWSSVITLDLNCWLVAREPNLIAVEVLGLHAGSMPISVQSWLEQISESARERNMEITWYRHNGHPIGLLKLDADKEHPTVILQRLELQEGKLLLAGRASDSSPLGAMHTPAGVLGR